MQRVIKFRAWDIPGKLMIYGGKQVAKDSNGDDRNYWTYIIPGTVDNTALEITLLDNGNTEKEVIYGHIMQYAGLKDKNGVEIYEGDIITIKYPKSRYTDTIEAVSWGEYSDGEYVDSVQCWMLTSDMPLETNQDYRVLEVIGNIYESPELLT